MTGTTEHTALRLSPAFCMHNGVLVLGQSQEGVRVGMVSLGDAALRQKIERAARRHTGAPGVTFVQMSQDTFIKKLNALFCGSGAEPFAGDKRAEAAPGTPQEPAGQQSPAMPDDNMTAALLDSILANACDECATDVHVEDALVRFRVRGSLHDYALLDGRQCRAMIGRIKVLAGLDPVGRHDGQDGQFTFVHGGHPVFARVSLLPSVCKRTGGDAESLVLRLLDASRVTPQVDRLGFTPWQVQQVQALCAARQGLVLVCGPTGSGKSTTAAAMLGHIGASCAGSRKVVSLEDPPEYVLAGVTQVAVRDDTGFTFDRALRRALRHDPDVLMVGEVRDRDTACIAVQAALTGHLVIATLHTATAEQAVLRMQSLGVEPPVLQSVLCGIIMQRLAGGVLSAQVLAPGQPCQQEAPYGR